MNRNASIEFELSAGKTLEQRQHARSAISIAREHDTSDGECVQRCAGTSQREWGLLNFVYA